MTGTELLLYIFWSLIWPPKGIIYFEEQVLQWIFAFGSVWTRHHMADLLIIIAIYFIFAYIVFERRNCHRHGITAGRSILNFILRMFVAIGMSWFMLVYGAVRGEINGTGGEENATIRTNFTHRRGMFYNVVQSIVRLSVHFQIGRGLYRIAYRILGRVPLVQNDRVRHLVARIIALVIILWGVWRIPFDLMH